MLQNSSCSKSFIQEYEIDYEETFAPVAHITHISSVHTLLAVVAASKWDLFQMDVKNAFLNRDLSEETYMQPPPGLSVESNKVCHLRRALYGLKQVPWVWFSKFSSTISRLGYMASYYDSTLFLCRVDKGTILLLLYVDDMIITSDGLNGIQVFSQLAVWDERSWTSQLFLGSWNHSFYRWHLYYSSPSQVCLWTFVSSWIHW